MYRQMFGQMYGQIEGSTGGYTMVENRKKLRHNSHPIIHFPTSEGVSEVSERANGRTDERVAQYCSLYFWLFLTIVLLSPPFNISHILFILMKLLFSSCTMDQNNQVSRRTYWATHSSVCLFSQVTHSFVHSLFHSPPSSWKRGFCT